MITLAVKQTVYLMDLSEREIPFIYSIKQPTAVQIAVGIGAELSERNMIGQSEENACKITLVWLVDIT